MKKKPFVTKEQLDEIIKKYPTPFHLYDEKGIRKNMQALKEAFAWNPGYKEYFAVKATPNPFLIDILREYGCGCDCSSYTELMLSDAIWMILRILISLKRQLARFQKRSVAGIIRADCLRLVMILWITREMPSLV